MVKSPINEIITSDLDEIDYTKLSKLDQIILKNNIKTNDNSVSTGIDSYYTLLNKYHNTIYYFNKFDTATHKRPFTNDTQLAAPYNLMLITLKENNIYKFKVQKMYNFDYYFNESNNNLSTILSNINKQRGKGNRIIRTKIDDYSVAQSLIIPVNDNISLIFIVEQKIKNNHGLSILEASKSLAIMDNNSKVININEIIDNEYNEDIKEIRFNELYSIVRKLYFSKEFEGFDLIIKLLNIQTKQYLFDKGLKQKLYAELIDLCGLNHRIVEQIFAPIYVNENGIEFYYENKPDGAIIAYHKSKHEIVPFTNTHLVDANDAIIVRSSLLFKLGKSSVSINPETCDVYLDNKRLSDDEYKIHYEDNDSLIIGVKKFLPSGYFSTITYTITYDTSMIYVLKAKGKFALLIGYYDKDLIMEISERDKMIKKLSLSP